MNYQDACGFNVGNYSGQPSHPQRAPWYCKFIKPFFSFVVSVLLALSMSHLCEKYSSNNSLQMIHSDLNNLRNNLNLLSNEVRTLMETRDEFKNKLKDIVCSMPKISEAILHLKSEVSEDIEVHTNKLLQALSPNAIKEMVRTELETYDADKTGKMDYALETAGGKVLTTRNTETYPAAKRKMFGIPFCDCEQQNTPQSIIQSGVLPGECWAFKGSQGVAVIQLLGYVQVTGFTLEHVSPLITPTGESNSAPKDFDILGLTDIDDKHGFLFGSFTYDNSGPPMQYFEVQNLSKKSYKIVELKVYSNNGNTDYTCIYRIRVHGILTSYENTNY